MQAIILAAGHSSRFYPYSRYGHKATVKLFGKPLIVHTIENLKKAGVTDIIIVTSHDGSIKQAVQQVADTASIRFITQDDAQGMGEALLRAKEYLAEEFFVLSAHHMEFSEVADRIKQKKTQQDEIILVAKKDIILGRYGVIRVTDDKVTGVTEKPKEPTQDGLRLVSIYLLSKAFISALEAIPLSHYHFEEALDMYAKKGLVRFVAPDMPFLSLKYPWDLFAIKDYLFERMEPFIAQTAQVTKEAIVKGNVFIDEGATVMEGAKLYGPCYIGKNAVIGTHAIVRNNSVIGDNVIIGARMEVRNTIFFEGATTHSGFIGDSIIGRESKVAAFFCTANVRLDREAVAVEVKGERVSSLLKSLGVFMGENVKAGIRVSTMPGVVIGNNVIIGPATVVAKNIADDVTFYTKFQEVVEKKRK